MNILIWIIFVFGLAIFWFCFFLYLKEKNKKELWESLGMTLFLIMLPKYDLKKENIKEKEEKMIISQMEQFYTNFLYLKKPGFFEKIFKKEPRIVLEIASQLGGPDISFYAAVPISLETAFEKYVHGVYPAARVEKVPQDYTIFEPKGIVSGSFLKLKENNLLPISTYKNLEKDPLASISNALSKIVVEEGAAIQIVIRPFSLKKWKKTAYKVLSKIKEGKVLKTAIAEAERPLILEALLFIIGIITGQGIKTGEKQQKEMEELRKKETKTDETVFQAIQSKVQKQIFETNIRLVASANTKERAEEILGHIESAFSQFSLFGFNNFESKRVKKGKLKKLIYDFSFRNFNSSQKIILNLEELTSVYHFPTPFIETPYIKTVKAGAAAPAVELPEKGINLIGKVDFRGEEKKVYFTCREDRRRHFYIIGQTGTGKSSLLKNMIRQDIEMGEGVGVIDPHGELIEDILSNIPMERAEDVVLFEPFDLNKPIGLNMLDYDTPEQKDFAVQEMISIFYKLFPPEMMGPMFEHYMRNAMLALMGNVENPGTLVEIPRIFTDSEFMQETLEKVTDPLVRNFWLKEWAQTIASTRSDMLSYVVSKVGRFVENEMMRNIIGQSRSGFDLGSIMSEGKIFLANLSKGLTGEVNSSLLGLILVSKMQMAAMKRSRIPEEQRKDFYLYIDEFQNFTTDSIATILSEARKYKLNLILAHQYIPQLREEIRNAVLGNVGTIGAFRIGANDAEFLEKQFEPEFSRFDLVNLDNFNLVIKMMLENKISSPFRMEIFKPEKGDFQRNELIKKLSKEKYGRLKELVEMEIKERSKLI